MKCIARGNLGGHHGLRSKKIEHEFAKKTDRMSGTAYFFQNQTSPPINCRPLFKFRSSKILIDPGHIGGEFSEMEGRHFSFW